MKILLSVSMISDISALLLFTLYITTIPTTPYCFVSIRFAKVKRIMFPTILRALYHGGFHHLSPPFPFNLRQYKSYAFFIAADYKSVVSIMKY